MKVLISKNQIKLFFLVAVFVASVVSPVFVLAQVSQQTSEKTIGIPCDGPKLERTGTSQTGTTTDKGCGYPELVQLVSNFMNFLILLSIPMAAIAFAWAGWLMITAGGSSGQIDQAKEIFVKVLIGFMFVLSAWLIVFLITKTLLRGDGFKNLLGQTPSSSTLSENQIV